jgi:hypothetical protein
MVSTMSGADYRQWEPVFPEWGVVREDFQELIDDLYFPADAIIGDVSLDWVVGNLFGAESDYVVMCNSLSGSFCKYNQWTGLLPFRLLLRSCFDSAFNFFTTIYDRHTE